MSRWATPSDAGVHLVDVEPIVTGDVFLQEDDPHQGFRWDDLTREFFGIVMLGRKSK